MLSGTAPPFTEVVAVGLADPELVAVFGEAEGLGEAEEAELPEAVVDVIVPEVEEVVVSDVGANADLT